MENNKDNIQEKQAPKRVDHGNNDFLNSVIEEVRQNRKSNVGRKTKRTPALIDEIVLLLRAGVPLEKACNVNSVTSDCVYNWRKADPELDKLITEAMMEGLETWEAKMLSIASGGIHSTGNRERDRDLVKVMQWIMGKRNPLYRDKVDVKMDATRFTIIQTTDIGGLLSAPPPIQDGEFTEVEVIEHHGDPDPDPDPER